MGVLLGMIHRSTCLTGALGIPGRHDAYLIQNPQIFSLLNSWDCRPRSDWLVLSLIAGIVFSTRQNILSETYKSESAFIVPP